MMFQKVSAAKFTSAKKAMETAIIHDTEQERKEILKRYRHLLRVIKPRLHREEDKRLVRRAFDVALEAHKEMRRKSGEPYILHPLAVATIVSEEMGLGPTSVICALLHDTVEDTEISLDEIRREFGDTVAKIVDGLTKISGVFDLQSSQQAENFRKLVLSLTDDMRVILIKIADRLHNMRTLEHMPRNKQLKIASETSFLYAPLAHRLGFYEIKSELEDLAMKYTETDMYRLIAKKLNETKRERNRYINEFIAPIEERLRKEGLKFRIYGRPKSIHSIWNKMQTKGVDFEQVYDLFAIRIIIDTPPEKEKAECWRVYSIVTDFYRPNPGRLRDWISNPKANGYEALHTTVIKDGKWVEVQIRTERMDEIAERGYAAHFKYKEGMASSESALDEWLLKMREIIKNPESNALDFINDFRLNLYSQEIYVFTPKGQLKRLPSNATALDFAFDIHTDIGMTCIGAKVNHKLVPLSHRLTTGDQVEIITSKKQKPTEDWLNFVITGKAKAKIKNALKEEMRLRAAEGKEMLERRLRTLRVEFSSDLLNDLALYYRMPGVTELYAAIAAKKIDLKGLSKDKFEDNRLILPKEPDKKTADKTSSLEEAVRNTLNKNAELLIFGDNLEKIDYKFAHCCSPIPGDDVFGFITINEGIKIHKTNCPNATQLMSNYGYRIIKTRWNKQHEISFLTELKVSGIDDVGVMQKITNVISGEMKLNMRSISFDTRDGIFEGTLALFVHDTTQLGMLIQKLKGIEGVLSVSRQ